MKNKISAFATSCYIMLGIKRLDRVNNTRTYALTDTQPLINLVRQRFLGHILRMLDEP